MPASGMKVGFVQACLRGPHPRESGSVFGPAPGGEPPQVNPTRPPGPILWFPHHHHLLS